jgi:cytochrome c oxidase subunit I+III
VLVYVLVHAAIGLILALHGWHSCRRGEISAARSLNLMIGQLWHDYSCVTGIAGLAATFGLAWAIGSGGLQR